MRSQRFRTRPSAALALGTALLAVSAVAQETPPPATVTIPGSLQSELGCPGDWMPDCAITHLSYDATDDVWQQAFDVPAGAFEYKAALNDSWDENYGLGAVRNGPNIPLTGGRTVKFYYDHKSHWVTDNARSIIATVPGSFQSELGCPGDWMPDCLRSWLQDPDGDGLYTFTTTAIPAGSYEAKVAINESWAENYGRDGVRDGANIPFTVPADGAEIFFQYDAASHRLTILDGAPRGDLHRARAHWVSRDTIAWNSGGAADVFALHADAAGGLAIAPDGVQGGTRIPLTRDPSGLPADVRAKFPHLAAFDALKVDPSHLSEVPALLKGQLAVSAVGPNGKIVDATSLQIPGVLDDLFTYQGRLGIEWRHSTPTLRLWAPTARSVKLHLFRDATTPDEDVLPMAGDAATGVWSITGQRDWADSFYLYEVEVFVPSTGHVERNMVTDPYSLSLSANSRRSQIVNLDDPRLEPSGWDHLRKPALRAPEDIVLYELHVRDFSATDTSVPAALRGTYKAFTVPSSRGMSHLRRLAEAGLTHVHLLPTFDVATIEEVRASRVEPDPAVLAGFPPDSDQQQAAVGASRGQDGFNWGYDPFHYTVPEGSYATDPSGSRRIKEFREMVKGLSESGLRVVMDVVYNHTNAAGLSDRSVLDKVVPGYYHRLNLDGNIETSSCCPNTASEHAMMEKLMVDSLLVWARAYKVDGFRFDIMGHHMLSNMRRIQDSLRALTLERDGVDGRKIYLYGEGWNFGEVANGARGVNATQHNVAGTGIGTFSDRMRDAVRGGGPFNPVQEQGFATGLFHEPNGVTPGSPAEQRARLLYYADLVRLGLAGNLADFTFEDREGHTIRGAELIYGGQPAGYTRDPQEVINYVEAHDNETFFDALQLKAPASMPLDVRVRLDELAVSTVMLSQGVPFFHAGQDLLRSKSLDRNSYDSGDWFNKLDFTLGSNNWGVGLPPAWDNQANWPVLRPLLSDPALRPQREHIEAAAAHFREMLRIRKSSPLFRLGTAEEVMSKVSFLNTGPDQVPGLVVMALADTRPDVDPFREEIVVVFNATPEEQTFTDAARRRQPFHLHLVQAFSRDPVVRRSSYDFRRGSFTVPAWTTAVFVANVHFGH